MSPCLQLYQWLMLFILSTSALTSVLALPRSASFSFIHLYSCPICEAQHDYDFTIAVQLALDNLEKSNGSIPLGVNGRSHSNIKEPDAALPAIQAIPLQCGDPTSLDVVAENASMVAVLTGGCHLASTEEAATIVDTASPNSNNDLLEVSYSPNIGELPGGPSSSFLSNNTIHMFPLQMNPATVLALLDFFGWKEAIVLTESHTQIEEVQSIMDTELGTRLISMVTLDGDQLQEPREVLEEVLEGDYHVIVVNTYPPTARRLLCQAYQLQRMHYPRYVWILPGWFEENWWREGENTNKSDKVVCTQEEMKVMLKNSLGITEAPSDYLGQNKLASLSFSAFNASYTSAVVSKNSTTSTAKRPPAPAELAAFAYDSVLLLASALSMQNASNNQQLTANDIIDISCTNGASGDISFDDMGWRITTAAYVTLYRETGDSSLERVLIGMVKKEKGTRSKFMYINNESPSTVWSGDEHPPVRTVINRIALPLTVIYYTLAALGIIFAFFCVGFNLKYRNCKVIRLSSPNLNYITCAGAILLLLSAFFIGSPSITTSLFPFLCMGNVWAGAIGASLQYGTIQAKMFRVYVIFRRPTQKNIILKDWHLAMYVAVLAIIDIVLLTIVTAIPEARSVGKLVVDQEHPPFRDDTGVTVMSLVHDCESQERGIDTYWFVLLFGYKLVLQIIVTVLAFLICSTKVNIEALNDHRAVQAITYVNMAILVVSVILAFAVSNYANAKAAVNGLSVLVGAFFNLSLVFLPKMYALYKDPKGRDIFRSPGNSTIAAATPEQSTSSSVASRRTTAKEEDTDASSPGLAPSSVDSKLGGLNDSKSPAVVTNNHSRDLTFNHASAAAPIHDHPLSFTNAYLGSPTSELQPDDALPHGLPEP